MIDADSIKYDKANDTDLYREIKKSAFNTFKIANKFRKVGKCALRLADEITKVPLIFFKVFYWSGTFKIVKGFLAIKKFNTSYRKAHKRDELFQKFYEYFRMTKAVKYMFDGVEAALKFMTDFQILSNKAGAFVKIAGRIFFPLTFIDCAVNTVRYVQTIQFMKEFNRQTALPNGDESIEKMQHVCHFILKQRLKLKSLKVITKQCPLKERTKDILNRLASANEIERQKAFNEGKSMVNNLQGRVSSRAFSQTLNTAIRCIDLTATIMALVCPILTLPLALIEFSSVLIKVANLYGERSIPNGDFSHNEEQSFYAIPLRSLIA